MRKKRFPWGFLLLFLVLAAGIFAGCTLGSYYGAGRQGGAVLETVDSPEAGSMVAELLDTARSLFAGEPEEVTQLRSQEVPQTDEGHQEYYFQLLSDEEKRGYREMLDGIRRRDEEFYITIYEDEMVDKVYHAVLKDHPEIFWVHNRSQVYKTTYSNSDYCLFAPGYSYTDAEMEEIQASMENAYQEVYALIPEGAGDYDIVKTVYTYLIDHAEYQASEHDQSISGIFWKKAAVCAGYAGAVQYLLERFNIPCIYVEGSAAGSEEGHAWNIVTLGGQYYYVDVTNGDQPEFLEGDAALLEEHKTIIYDYLCPFPWEYETVYTPSAEFPVPECTATDLNFYVLNQGCFDTYDFDTIYQYCQMRLNNGAAVVRFKFSSQDAFDQAKTQLIDQGEVQSVARYYMELYGMGQVEYHYGVLDNLKTMYFMF